MKPGLQGWMALDRHHRRGGFQMGSCMDSDLEAESQLIVMTAAPAAE